MDNIQAHSLDNVTHFSTKLNDRILWYDGDSSFDANQIIKLSRKYNNIKYVDHINDVVDQYNQLCSNKDKLCIKTNLKPLSDQWNLPTEYKNLNVKKYLIKAHNMLFENLPQLEKQQREKRLLEEFKLYEEKQLLDVLRAVIYIVNTLTAQNVVWGVGRGSSVSSYILYVIGVHDVDSFAYELDIKDFIHE